MKIFLAGAENLEQKESLTFVKAPYVLLSYHNLRNMNREKVVRILNDYKEQNAEILIDSGAFTLFTEHGLRGHSKEVKKKTNLDFFFLKYLSWLKEHKDKIDYYVELDMGRAVGMEKVEMWREKMLSKGLDRLIPVYHPEPNNGIDVFEKLCQDFDYVAVEGMRTKFEYGIYFKIAEKYKTKLHGFAMTDVKRLKILSFYSVDSTSWTSGCRYGITYFFDDFRKQMRYFGNRQKHKRLFMKSMLESKGIIWEKIIQDDRVEVNKMNALSWMEYNRYIDDLHQKQKKKYWEDN